MSLIMVVLLAATPTATPTPVPSLDLLRGAKAQEAAKSGSLSDVAKGIKLRLPEGESRVLTNDSVRQLSQGVELTTAIPYDAPAVPRVSGGASDASREMWQQRYQFARWEAARLDREIARLEGEVAALETQFYALDDPFARDGQVKPQWDAALAELREAKARQAEVKAKPSQIIDKARRAGGLPGWFRGLPEPDPDRPPPAVPREVAFETGLPSTGPRPPR
jgi:hypothetical protein